MKKENQRVLITGGSRGIGRALVFKFMENGWDCAFTYVSNKGAAQETRDLAAEKYPGQMIKYYQLDVKSSTKVDQVLESVLTDFENIQALINNAAVVKNNAAVMMSDEEWDEVLATNLSGPFFLIRNLLMHFIANRSGRIINLSSLAQDGCSGQVNYAASKSGLIGMTKTLAKEYGPKGVTANVVTVGYVETEMTQEHMAQSLHDFWMKHCPLKRVGSAEDIANMVYFLCSEEGGFINGEVIRISGGLTYAP